jgi:hypothetical protein
MLSDDKGDFRRERLGAEPASSLSSVWVMFE